MAFGTGSSGWMKFLLEHQNRQVDCVQLLPNGKVLEQSHQVLQDDFVVKCYDLISGDVETLKPPDDKKEILIFMDSQFKYTNLKSHPVLKQSLFYNFEAIKCIESVAVVQATACFDNGKSVLMTLFVNTKDFELPIRTIFVQNGEPIVYFISENNFEKMLTDFKSEKLQIL